MGARFCNEECTANFKKLGGKASQTLSPVDAAYLAGIIDGEGSIILYRREKAASLRLSVCNTNEDLVRWCQEKTAVGNITTNQFTNGRWKDRSQWLTNSRSAQSIIVQIRPHLIVKPAQADLALEYWERRHATQDDSDKSWQEHYRLRMCALNKRGPAT